MTSFLPSAAEGVFFTALGGFKAVVDGGGLKLTLLGMMVVFSGLVVLTILFANLERMVNGARKLTQGLSAPAGKEREEPEEEKKQMTGEEAAAACLALALYHRMHMEERRHILTIKSEIKMLSPWALSGKIHKTKTPIQAGRR
jgi:Na+-transporting methylmalonyl-CoA/oxaloacetate decarboxylase gamma subunit